jgi:cellulose synthase/poly-beta-1,6-N-acetylglucosamine synthase-like glycosyltransferase
MLMNFVFYCWNAVQCIIGYNLFLPLLLFVMYVFSNKRNKKAAKGGAERDYAIIVTAYEQTDSLPPVIASILQLDYSNYIVYIVADKCDVSQLKFSDKRVVVLRPPETLASNTRSHFYAIRNFVRAHDMLTIIDSDNLVDSQYLHELNKYADYGFEAIQGIRKAKNLNTTFACLDAARDIYYHFFDGEVLFRVGSSATLAGSGMAFTTSLYRKCLEHQDITGAGFDKVLQMEIVSRGYRIAFAADAVVYDEKTTQSDQLVKQRARWINTWFRYFKFGFKLLGQGLFSFNFNKFLFGVVLLRPPLFIFLLLSMFFAGTDLLLSMLHVGSLLPNGNAILFNCFLIWLAGFAAFIGGFVISIAHAKPDKRITKSLLGIPMFIFYQVLALLRIRRANSISVATTHYNATTIDEVKK